MERIVKESQVFLLSVLLGIVLLFFYDFFRILRAIFPHRSWLIFWEDYLFWLCSGFCVFLFMYQENSGMLRGFALGGIGLGMLGYHLGPSTYWVRGVSYLPRKIRRWLRHHTVKRKKKKM